MPGRRWQSVGAALLASSMVLACDELIGLTDPTVADAGDQGLDAAADAETSDDVEMGLDAATGDSATSDGVALDSAADVYDGSASDSLGEPDGDAPEDFGIDTFCQTFPQACDATAISDAIKLFPDVPTPPAPDSTAGEGGQSAEAGLSPPTEFFVNAGPDLPAVRVCFEVPGSSVAAIRPLPDRLVSGQTQPGIERWAGEAFPSGIYPEGPIVVAYLIPADAIPASQPDGGAPDCVALIGADAGGGLVPSGDFWAVRPGANGPFESGTSSILLFTGCLPRALDSAATAERCGPTYDPSTGNLNAETFVFVTTMAPPGVFFGRAIQASAPIDGVLTSEDSAYVGLHVYVVPPEAGAIDMTLVPIAFDQEAPELTPMNFPPPIAADVLLVVAQTADGGVLTTYTPTFGAIAEATVDASTAEDGGPYFAGGETYTFVIVGDPTAAPDSGLQPHAVAFPDHPVVPSYP